MRIFKQPFKIDPINIAGSGIKKIILFCFLIFILDHYTNAQAYFEKLQSRYNSVKDKNDTSTVNAMLDLSIYYEYTQTDSTLTYAKRIIDLSEILNYEQGKYFGLRSLLLAINARGNYPKALEVAMNNLRVVEQFKNNRIAAMALAHHDIGLITREMKDYAVATRELRQAIALQQQSTIWIGEMFGPYTQLGVIQLNERHLDSALYYVKEGSRISKMLKFRKPYECLATAVVGNVFEALKNYDSAKQYYQLAVEQAEKYDNNYIKARVYNNLAGLFNKMSLRDSCVQYALAALEICQHYNFGAYAADASSILSAFYEDRHQPDSALKYIKVMLAAKDTIFSQAKMQQVQLLVFDEEQRQKEIAAAKERYRNEVRLYALLSALFVLLLLSAILYRNNVQRKTTNATLKQQKSDLQNTLDVLKSTQTRLIHSQKMASLGELTAGIAHEIQNPLNFVNNFSEVNEELLDEMKEAVRTGHSSEAIQLAEDIKENLDKILHHGQRADAIVKSMLQHSRTSTGRKESTDINTLAEEYLRLSYHGMRTKDKSFNATINTDFDSRLGKIMLDPQSIGRVLLNLINNAFYSVNEKRKKSDAEYEPEITVRTRKIPASAEGWPTLEIKVIDNGMGVAEPILGKIFQPFFTTKGPGQGTGLGLSLSYDIVNKEHGGQIDVDTHEGEYAEFIIRIPLKENLK